MIQRKMTDNKKAKRLYSRKEAAEFLGISLSTLIRLIKRGVIPTVKIGARRLIDRQDLDRYVEMNKEVFKE